MRPPRGHPVVIRPQPVHGSIPKAARRVQPPFAAPFDDTRLPNRCRVRRPPNLQGLTSSRQRHRLRRPGGRERVRLRCNGTRNCSSPSKSALDAGRVRHPKRSVGGPTWQLGGHARLRDCCVVETLDRDWLVRQHAFRFLEDLSVEHGDVLPWESLRDGVEVDGQRITLIGARGIWKPAALELPAGESRCQRVVRSATPGRSANADPSAVRTVRPVARAVAAMIRSWAPRGRPARRTATKSSA